MGAELCSPLEMIWMATWAPVSLCQAKLTSPKAVWGMCITRNASLKSQRSLNKEPKRCCKVPTVLVSNSAVEPRSRACEMEQALWGAGKADPLCAQH